MIKRSWHVSLCVWGCLFLSLSNAWAKPVKRSVKAFSVQRAALVVNGNTGQVYYAHHPDTLVYPASLTKMMTLYLLLEALEAKKVHLHTPMKISPHAQRQIPSKLGLKVGKTLRVHDAIMGLTVKSANDVAVVVAEHLAGTEKNFARLMTVKARHLKMPQTTFHNASGVYHPHQKTTARDMVRLSQALYRRFPSYYRYFGVRTFTFQGHPYRNTNKLLGVVPGVDGIKTGFICASGFNLAASAQRHGIRLFAVVMGGISSQDRNRRMRHLLEAAFHQYAPKGSHKERDGIVTISRHPNPRLQLAQVTSRESLPFQKQILGAKRILVSNAARPRSGNVEKRSYRQETLKKLPQKDSLSSPEETSQRDIILALALAPPHKPRLSKKILVATHYSSLPFQRKKGEAPSKKRSQIRSSSSHPRDALEWMNRASLSRGTSTWSIQIGAYRLPKQAYTYTLKTQKNLGGAFGCRPEISRSTSKKRNLYRARLIGFTEKKARKACQKVMSTGGVCLVIPPHPAPRLTTVMR